MKNNLRESADLVFDLDGTLSDPAEGFMRSLNYALKEHGLTPFDYEELAPRMSDFMGPPLDEVFRALPHIDADADADVTQLIKTYRERYSTIGYSENVMYEGVPLALQGLGDLGLTMGVCTSKRTDFAKKILEMFQIRDKFLFVHGGEVGVRKQDQLADLIDDGRIHENSIMVGDRALDVNAAKHNRLKSVAVLYGYGSSQEIQDAEPTAIVRTPQNLVRVIQELGRIGFK